MKKSYKISAIALSAAAIILLFVSLGNKFLPEQRKPLNFDSLNSLSLTVFGGANKSFYYEHPGNTQNGSIGDSAAGAGSGSEHTSTDGENGDSTSQQGQNNGNSGQSGDNSGGQSSGEKDAKDAYRINSVTVLFVSAKSVQWQNTYANFLRLNGADISFIEIGAYQANISNDSVFYSTESQVLIALESPVVLDNSVLTDFTETDDLTVNITLSARFYVFDMESPQVAQADSVQLLFPATEWYVAAENADEEGAIEVSFDAVFYGGGVALRFIFSIQKDTLS